MVDEEIISLIFAGHPYHYPVIGYKHELWNLQLHEIERFYRAHYVPNNATLVVVGDGCGKIGFGYGKGNEVPFAVEKAVKDASKRLVNVPLHRTTIPHSVVGKYGASVVMLMPANAGTGVIAGSCIRSVAESLGVRDLLTKSRGSSNPLNVIKATFAAISLLRSRQDVLLSLRAK